MKFAQMLAMTVSPQSPTRGRTKKRHPKPVEHSAQTWLKYQTAISLDWSTTKTIAERANTSPASISKQLSVYLGKDLIERRPKDGKPFHARKGYEWRVK